MNIYVLHYDPIQCARQLHDAHLMYKAAEYTRILEEASQARGLVRNHTSAPKNIFVRWACDNQAFVWLLAHTWEILGEQDYRFGHFDKKVQQRLKRLGLPSWRASGCRFPTFMQMVESKVPGDVVEAYRQEYRKAKMVPSWCRRGAPEWWVGAVQAVLEF